MKPSANIVIALLVGLLGGLGIAVQATISGVLSRRFGSIPAGMMVGTAGGTMSLILLIVFWKMLKVGPLSGVVSTLPLLSIAGIFGMTIVVSVSVVVFRLGVAAGLTTVIGSQLLFGLVFDALGLTGQAIAITPIRVIGMGSVIMGTFLMTR